MHAKVDALPEAAHRPPHDARESTRPIRALNADSRC